MFWVKEDKDCSREQNMNIIQYVLVCFRNSYTSNLVLLWNSDFSPSWHRATESSHSPSSWSGWQNCLENETLCCLDLACPVWSETHYGPPSAHDEHSPTSHHLPLSKTRNRVWERSGSASFKKSLHAATRSSLKDLKIIICFSFICKCHLLLNKLNNVPGKW